ncbi:MAG: MotA/TolQ/ExbB proton channel family protein [Bdellovibrionales bacterium]|nr:MotA/TolQ/ExbB proton channel family protein [Bdellovibrionales bacterium]
MDQSSIQMDYLHILMNSDIIVQAILLLLIFLSVLSWAIIIKKRKSIKEINKQNDEFLKVYSESASFKDIINKTQELSLSSFKTMFVEGHNEIEKLKELDFLKHFDRFGLEGVERSLKKGMNDSNLRLDSLLSILASVGSISPFIGLLGTVWGIIHSFAGLAKGGGTLEAVAPGIAEALIATAVGLFAAIPAVWFFNYFSNSNSQVNKKMESFAQSFLNRVEHTLSSSK